MNMHTKIAAATATIDQLKPGSERPGGSINSRKDYAPADVKARLESILAFGVLRPLLVQPGPDTDKPPFYVADGGLSREAVALGVTEKKLPKDYAVKISFLEGDGALALAASLEANEQVLPPHPVKVYETFAELASRGKTEAEIGKLFRMGTKEVKGVLALGALSPTIRQAWKDEKIDADDAKAFTLAKDHDTQDAVFKKLKHTGNLYDHQIRAAIVGDNRDAQRFLTYVGKAAYEGAGGTLQEDLFSQGKHFIVGDMPLLKKLVDEKYLADVEKLKAGGWGEVIDAGELPHDAWYNWKKVPNGGSAPKATKAKALVAHDLDREGKLELKYYFRPAVKKGAAAKPSKDAKAKAAATISNSLRERLDQQLTHATKDALKAQAEGATLAHLLAGIVSAQINEHRPTHTAHQVSKAFDKIRQLLPGKDFNPALAKRFDFKAYFQSAPKPFVIRAITEMGFADDAKKLGAGTKAAAWKWALAHYRNGWLPPELRTTHYTGPGATKKKAR